MLGLIALLVAGAMPQPEQLYGTWTTSAYPTTLSGKRVGCAVEFDVLIRDFTYRQGEPTLVSGNMTFANYPNAQPALTLKVLLQDFTSGGDPAPVAGQPPASISLVGINDESNAPALIKNMKGEDARARLAAFNLSGFPEIFDRAITSKELILLFNRRGGVADVRVPVDLTIVGNKDGDPQHGGSTLKNFIACSGALLKDIKAQGKEK